MGAIFISYRREDTEGHAGRLFDDLQERFGKGSVFIDVTSIALGTDFREAIDTSVSTCSVLLAMIGNRWLEVKNDAGVRRIDDPADFVRLETASALKRKIPVVPVLVHGARMPTADALPPDLQALAFRNGMELTHARWDSDVAVLMDALQKYMGAPAADGAGAPTPAPRQPAPVPAPAPAPQPAVAAPGGRAKAVGVAAAVLLAGAVGAYWVARHRPPPPVPAPTPIPAAPAPAPGPAQKLDRRQIQSLIADVDSADQTTRKAATTRLIRELGASSETIGLVLEQLTVANLNALRVEGRVNVLSYLAESDLAAWTAAQRAEGVAAVQRMRQNIASGRTKAGPQVSELIQALGAKLGV